MITFSVTYERVNEEEGSIGDTDRRGYLGEDLSLRDALKLMGEDIDSTACVEFSKSPLSSFSHAWLSQTGRHYATWDSVTNSLHPSTPLSAATWKRIKAMLGRV